MKRSRFVSALGVCILAGLTYCGTSVASASTSAPPPSKLLALAIQNADASGWVHEITNASGPGHKWSADNVIGTTEGRQNIVSDGAHARVLVVGGNAYIYGDDKAITNYFGISTANPQKYANQWLELTPSNPGYSTVSNAVTLTSDLGHLEMQGKLKEGQVVVIDGHKVCPITGHIPATSQAPAGIGTAYVTTAGRILPFEYRITANGIKSTTSWTQWGHAVKLAAPNSSTPLSY